MFPVGSAIEHTIGATKQVRFANNDSFFSAADGGGDDGEASLWLAPNEYFDLKRRLRDEAERLKPRGYGILLKNAYDEKHPSHAQKYIDAFAQLPGELNLRGSEVFLSHQHRAERDLMYERLTSAVIKRQKFLKEKQDISADAIADKLRNISRKHSRSSRIFARRLGLADQRAVKEGDDLIKAMALIKSLNNGNAKMAIRKLSVESDLSGLASTSGEQGVAQMLGLSYRAGHNYRPQPNQSLDKTKRGIPAHLLEAVVGPNNASNGKSTGNHCATVIQSALELLDFGDDDMMVGAPTMSSAAKSA